MQLAVTCIEGIRAIGNKQQAMNEGSTMQAHVCTKGQWAGYHCTGEVQRMIQEAVLATKTVRAQRATLTRVAEAVRV